MSKNKEEIQISQERLPRYIIKEPKFSCPLSPYVLWHHNLAYTECPVDTGNRDMPSCDKCKCRGDSSAKIRGNKKDGPKLKKKKEAIPNIGKSYTSE